MRPLLPGEVMAVPSTLVDAPGGPWYAWAGMVGWQPVASAVFSTVTHELRCRPLNLPGGNP